ncbi:hypothetical protein ACGFZP_13360 [Kitasatospora sp. NPDC048239]|uniref:hypothetical protein n=1 Tax=Kitasatospora sp. NPDC048239 TaxID=3364046 RepID=UPI0037153942
MSLDWTSVSALGVSGVTLAGTVYTARAGRRTRGQERRDDFAAVTDRMERELERLGKRVDEQELETAQQRARISGQDYTIRYLAGWVRSLVGFVQTSGLEPPPAPQPVPEDVRPYLHDLGV